MIRYALALGLMTCHAMAADCAAEQAHYREGSDPDGRRAELRLMPLDNGTGASDMFLRITTADPDRVFDFTLLRSPSRDVIAAVPRYATAPEPLTAYFFSVDERDHMVEATGLPLPHTGTKAPDAVFISRLTWSLHYQTSGQKNPTVLPTEPWFLARCER